MKGKIIKDGNQRGSYVLIAIGALIGIIIVSILKHGEINSMNLAKPVSFTATLFFIFLLLRIGVKKVNTR